MIKGVLLAFAPVALLAAPAIAASDEATSVVISTADLDLTHSAGQAIFAKRIDRAAQTACERPFIRDLSGMVAYESCVADVKDQALRQMAENSLAVGPALAAR